jgi:hypothetical protein
LRGLRRRRRQINKKSGQCEKPISREGDGLEHSCAAWI